MPFLGVPLLQATRLLITWFAWAKHRSVVSLWASHRVVHGLSIVNNPLNKAKKYSSKPRTWDGQGIGFYLWYQAGRHRMGRDFRVSDIIASWTAHIIQRQMFQARLVALSCLNYQNISEIEKANKSDLWYHREKYMEKPKSSPYSSPLKCRFILQHDKMLHEVFPYTYFMVKVVGLHLQDMLFG